MTEEKAVPSGENLPAEGSLPPETPSATKSQPASASQILTGHPLSTATPTSLDKPPPPAPELNLEKRLKQVYADNLMTTTEFMALRDDADRLFEKLKNRFSS
ncbi:hypothetical protein SAMN05444064_104260 [Pseudomonas syringae]|uniref:hypothetical protein n=1 Tax=Pseudomonas syringae TaxID=317 RepID=UPI00089C00CB|nr:hypothetical protein [Pseudomonas syringae]SDW55143.1 hypothetical protein SAMN05444514_104261 [Pseudomonas syringae]SFL79519.1 hypothetical protein SAMN05444064_104260 [Pseudomonas syringae]